MPFRFYRYNTIWTRLGRPFPTKYIAKGTVARGLPAGPFPDRAWVARRPGAYVFVIGFPSDFVANADFGWHFLIVPKVRKTAKTAKVVRNPKNQAMTWPLFTLA
jgi:hypothetical protein